MLIARLLRSENPKPYPTWFCRFHGKNETGAF